MDIAQANLEEVLHFRDRRQAVQTELLNRYKMPLISFTMNIAGPVKRFPLAEFAFHETLEKLRAVFGSPVFFCEERCTAGCEAFFVIDGDAAGIKRKCMEIEDSGEIGRLLDLDVIAPDGQKLSRSSERRCIVCGKSVTPCARSRAHSLEQICARANEILASYAAARIGAMAVTALMEELHLTPKPGLVDLANNGAHKDMDVPLMERSAQSLRPYFEKAARLGIASAADLPQVLQQAGIEAEALMFSVTGGVNTHKGAVFSLGLLCAAAGMLLTEGGSRDLFTLAAGLAGRLSVSHALSHGEIVSRRYSVGGARCEALAGFPHVKAAAGMLRSHSKLDVLLSIIAQLNDSNLLWRGGREGLSFLQSASKRILLAPPEDRAALVSELDKRCIERNLSPGGAADLFAAALFAQSFSLSFCP